MSKKILVCGRGSSLESIDDPILKESFDYVILVNEFNSFCRLDPKMSNFLSDKKIIQFVNITESGLDEEFVKNFDVDSVYITRLRSRGQMTPWWREPRRCRRPEGFGYSCRHPSDKLEEYMPIVENSTDIVLLFSILDLEATDLYVIGVDFYESGYHLDHSEADYLEWDETEKNSVINRIQGSHKIFISKFPDVKFTYITKSSFDPQMENCKVLRIKDEG